VSAEALPQAAGESSAEVVARRRTALLFVVLIVTSTVALVGGVLWPDPATGDWYSYRDIAPIRHRWWVVVTALSISLVLNVPAQALAAVLLTRDRGAVWTTVGAGMMWVGTGFYAAGAAGWAAFYFFATDPALDAASGTRLLDQVGDDPRMFAIAIPGAVLVALGTAVQAAGLWRSRALPRWVPILTLVIILTFIVPTSGPIGLLVEIPVAVAGIALGYFAWRRAGGGRRGDPQVT
jgi:hypothetical protein